MNLKLLSRLFGASLALSMSQAWAQDTSSLSITGSLVPGGCSISFGQNGNVNLGNHSSADLNAGQVTPLPDVEVPYTLRCGGPTKISMLMHDLAQDSIYGEQTRERFGLGLQGQNKIGYFTVTQRDINTDQGPTTALVESVEGWGWRASDSIEAGPSRTTWGLPGGGHFAPLAYSNVQGILRFSPVIAPSEALDVSDDIPMRGEIWVELSNI